MKTALAVVALLALLAVSAVASPIPHSAPVARQPLAALDKCDYHEDRPFSPYCHDNATGGHDCWDKATDCDADLARKKAKKTTARKKLTAFVSGGYR